jgi:hypothetical protein
MTYYIFEKCIRGGISGVMGSRYAIADYNTSAKLHHKLLYVDANNLCGWAMMESPPYRYFKSYIPQKELTKEDIFAIEDDSGIGFFLEVCFGFLWFGLVWFGLVWFGLVWFSLVCFGLLWFSLVLFCLFVLI